MFIWGKDNKIFQIISNARKFVYREYVVYLST